jgi:hypothetical protein
MPRTAENAAKRSACFGFREPILYRAISGLHNLYRALKDQVEGGAGPLKEAVDNLLQMYRTVM